VGERDRKEKRKTGTERSLDSCSFREKCTHGVCLREGRTFSPSEAAMEAVSSICFSASTRRWCDSASVKAWKNTSGEAGLRHCALRVEINRLLWF